MTGTTATFYDNSRKNAKFSVRYNLYILSEVQVTGFGFIN